MRQDETDVVSGLHFADEPEQQTRPPWEETKLTKKERRLVILGSLKATLLIGGVYLLGAAALIGLMVFFWR